MGDDVSSNRYCTRIAEGRKKEKTTRKAHNENCKRIQSNIIMVKKAGAKGGKRRPLSARFGLFLAA
jgi:hypothetical protein